MANRPYKPKDFFFEKAKAQGLRARSAFKIEEIIHRQKLLKRGDVVLDLGAAPGGFLQVIAEAVGPKGYALGVDIVEIRNLNLPNVETRVLDVRDDAVFEALEKDLHKPVNCVVSDMAPKTTGIKSTDEARSFQLAHRALEIAARFSQPGAHFVAKLFMGGDFEEFRNDVKAMYQQVKIIRPEATRGASFEVYLVGTDFVGARATIKKR